MATRALRNTPGCCLKQEYWLKDHSKRSLRQVREGFEKSGMTDDELEVLVENAREDFYRERLTEDE